MNVLIVTWYFPPANTMGALRLGKLAKYLIARGHEVRVIAAQDVPRPQTLALEVPQEIVHYTPWFDVNLLPRAVAKFRRRLAVGGKATGPSGGAVGTDGDAAGEEAPAPGQRGLAAALANLYLNLVNWPDACVGWAPYAVGAAKRLLRDWRPEIIFASAPPFTALLVGYLLGRRYGLPWIAEFRDRWTDDPYYVAPPMRLRVERRLERCLTARSSGIVTVSEPWAATYRERYGKPVLAVYNGFDPEDYQDRCPVAPQSNSLHIVYTGRIYPGRRDPSPLFEAISKLKDRDAISVDFYGVKQEQVEPLARRFGVAEHVHVHPHVPYTQAIRLQQEADVLLFMQWNDPREQGNVPGKLFEYLAARRPMLALGLDDGVPASIIRERSAGFFSNDPDDIAEQLAVWLKIKRTAGSIETLPASTGLGFSRQEQFAELEEFLMQWSHANNAGE